MGDYIASKGGLPSSIPAMLEAIQSMLQQHTAAEEENVDDTESKIKYRAYYPDDVLAAGIKSGRYFKG